MMDLGGQKAPNGKSVPAQQSGFDFTDVIAMPAVAERCRSCGVLLGTDVFLTCEACLAEEYRRGMLEHQREILRARPATSLRLGYGRTASVRHFVLFGNADLGFCGARLFDEPPYRRAYSASDLPASICQDCRRIYAQLKESK